jgi:hypothetical protein
MSGTVSSLFWSRTDTVGTEHVLVDRRDGVVARGTAQAVDPIPYTCRYELRADAGWSPLRLEVSTEGAGWSRSVRLERSAQRWRVTAGEQGDLDAALAAAGRPAAGIPGAEDPDRLAGATDLDLGAAPLFNTLPVRRLGLLDAVAGETRSIQVAWVLVPGLLVVPTEQLYTTIGPGRIQMRGEGYTVDLTLDGDGFVRHYPGLAERVEGRRSTVG